MREIFLSTVNLSIVAGWIVLAVLLLRLIFKKSPKWIRLLLWSIVGIRLACPFSLESIVSLVPSGQTVPTNLATLSSPVIKSGVPLLDQAVNPLLNTVASAGEQGAGVLDTMVLVFSWIWGAGVLALLLYALISYCRVRGRVKTAVPLQGNVRQCETVTTPFVFGVIRPKIYLPFTLEPGEMDYVIAHEQSHLKRKDHIWKPLGFLLVAVYWFHPLLWLGFIMFCRDIELACDERVIKKLNFTQRADYSQALLNCSGNHRRISACPLAFGEVGVKQRVQGVLGYQHPGLGRVLVAMVAVVATAICLLTVPPEQELSIAPAKDLLFTLTGTNQLSQIHEFEIIHQYGGITTDITDTNDLAFLQAYTYSHPYPPEEQYKLYQFPETQLIKVTNGSNTHQTLYLLQDGSIVVQQESEYQVYVATGEEVLHEASLIELLKKYGGYW